MSVIELLSTPVFNAITWALLYSLWQAAILYALTWLLLQVNKQAPAHIKHTLAAGAQLIISIWLVITFIQHLQLNVEAKAALESSQAAILFSPLRLPLMGGLDRVTETGQVVPDIKTLLPIFMLLYLAGLIFMGWRMLVGYQQTRILRRQRLTKVDNELSQLLIKVQTSLQVKQRVGLFISGLVNSPVLIGFLRPVILLPLSIFTQLSPEQVKAIIIHEVAHIRRMDYLTNYLQSFLEAVLFFNPFVWLLSKIMRDEREKACDEWVVREISPHSYASALLALEVARKETSMAMAAKRKAKYPLFNRIKTFTMNPNNKPAKINFKQKMVSIFLVLLSISCLAWLTPSGSRKADPHAGTILSNQGNRVDSAIINQKTNVVSGNSAQTQHQETENKNLHGASDTSILSPELQAQIKNIQESARQISSSFENNPKWDAAMKDFEEKAKSMGESFKMDPKMEKKLADLGSEIGKIAESAVNSPEFKKHLEALQAEAEKAKAQAPSDSLWDKAKVQALAENYGEIVKRFMQDPEWQSSLKAIQEQAKAISSKFADNAEWNKSIKELAAQAGQLSKSMVESPEFKKQIEQIKEQASQLKFEAEKERASKP